MFYTIYKITNLLNDKIYIGKHQTDNLNDGYMGSGKYLKHSIKKYGIENFKKEIIFVFDNENDMNAKEAEIVTEDFCANNNTYNICVGGKGGFSYVNKNSLNVKQFKVNKELHKKASRKGAESTNYRLATDSEFYLKWRSAVKNSNSVGFTGKVHTDETKIKMSLTHKNNGSGVGSKNSQYGTMWITNGHVNKKIKKDIDIIPDGWYKGRK